MASEEEYEARLANAEREARLARVEASHALVLAKGADRDVASSATQLAADRKLIAALRETQIEQGRDLTDMRHDLAEVKLDLAEVKLHVQTGFQLVEEKLATQAEGQAQITALLNRIIDDK